MKTVQLITDSEAFKALYFDSERQALRPNLVFVDQRGAVFFETNDLGLKGDPVDPSRKVAVVWGDSVVFSVGWGWPCLIDRLAPGYQFLNGGLDGDLYTNVLTRAVGLNCRQKVALNVVMPGWHPFDERRHMKRDRRWSTRLQRLFSGQRPLQVGNRKLSFELTRFVRVVPNTVLVTMPTALNPGIIDQDISGYFVEGDDAIAFDFLGTLRYSVPTQQKLYAHILERNDIIRQVTAAEGVPLVDFFKTFDTTSLPDFRRDFRDILHFRPSIYPTVAQRLYDAIAHLLR